MRVIQNNLSTNCFEFKCIIIVGTFLMGKNLQESFCYNFYCTEVFENILYIEHSITKSSLIQKLIILKSIIKLFPLYLKYDQLIFLLLDKS